MKKFGLFLLCLFANSSGAFAQGTIRWNEAVNGPLGNSAGTATSLGLLGLGTNAVIGATEIEPIGGNWLIQADFYNLDCLQACNLTGYFSP